MSNRTSTSALPFTFGRVSDFLTINRFPETIGYNVAYFGLGSSLALNEGLAGGLTRDLLPLLVAFAAVMLSKMQASVADSIHDHKLDERNPEKAQIATAIHQIGIKQAHTVLVGELIVALGLWGWLSLYFGTPFYLAIGVVITFLGFVYSYPPRLKERGILNHITTTGVDVLCVLLPFTILVGTPRRLRVVLTLGVVFLYAFAYHVLHQAGDTYYDREYGVATFTQSLGVPVSVLLASVLTVLAGIVAVALSHFLGGVLLLAVGSGYGHLFIKIGDMTEKEQSDYVSQRFDIGLIALCLNISFAISVLL